MNIINLVIKFFYIPFFLILSSSGLGIESIWVSWSGMFVSIVLILFLMHFGRKLKIPENFKLFLLIILLMTINLLWTYNFQASLNYLFLFIAGGAFWLFSYNFPDRLKFSKTFVYILLILGVFFGQYILIEELKEIEVVKSFAVTGFSGINRNHHHIGDYFAVVAMIGIYKSLQKNTKNFWWIILIFISMGVILYSQSRSAILSLAVSAGLLFWQKGYIEKYKKLFYVILLILVGFTFYIAQYKSLLLSRAYFVQGIAGVINNPLGVGMGNFEEISMDSRNHLFGLDSFSSVAHNLALEFLTGMGVLGFVFIYFYFKSILYAIKNIGKSGIFSLIFISLSVNFFFDFTYAIPTMLWIWFISLGLIKKSDHTQSEP